MNTRVLKFIPFFIVPLLAFVSFTQTGWLTWSLFLFVFGIVPLLELVMPADGDNLTAAEEELEKNNPWYDWVVYMIVPVHYALLIYFLLTIGSAELMSWELAGRVGAMGILCGGIGINIAHELGHRAKKSEQFMAKSLLLTTLYMHFFIEHNQGHHKNVSTDLDPATSRYGENVFAFFVRSITGGFLSAWNIEAARLKRKKHAFFSIHNQMIHYMVIQGALCLGIFLLFGGWTLFYFLIASLCGILILETVNYIEHYGLIRKKVNEKRYERVLPIHSWNSNHTAGRILMFELTRHSDHHHLPTRKYQILRNIEEAPQMPTGYPGMMILSLFPPLWFHVMHKHIDKLSESRPGQLSFGK